ncbi:type IX secretion system ring protein PorN/GldN [Larkinella soli]|uniref:type IX secretion system ring protein PorN/GldN n=1 Tax=Larkinella soli TaxID=1770527 RepID=UPI000FFBE959|nr:gliding motility protein GldN [Larkinella soli]
MKQVGSVALAAILAAMAGGAAQAQEKENSKANPLSVREINENDIMMKKTLWRRVDLNEKQNQAMFSKNNQITKYLLDAVKAGVLTAYPNDSVNTPMAIEKFAEKLAPPEQGTTLTAEEKAAGFGDETKTATDGWGDAPKDKKAAAKKPADDGWGAPAPKNAAKAQPADDGWGTPAPKKKTATAKNAKGKKGAKTTPAPEPPKVDTTAVAATTSPFNGNERLADEFSVLDIKEDWVFDRKRSRLYYDIQTVGIVIPADKNPSGLEVPVAYFKYKDLDKLFRSDPKKFIWYNAQNQAQHKNLADAFDLRLFYGRIYKVSNPKDRDLIGLYGSEREGLMKSYQTEQELMEAEHGLWEY